MNNTTDQKSLIDRMFAAGAHFGYSKARRHASTKQYIYGAKNRVQVIDLEKTQDLVENAKKYVQTLGEKNAMILVVSGKHEAQELVREAAEKMGVAYVAGRWLGGTLTNWTQIKKRIEHFEKLQKEQDEGKLSKYTKREQLTLTRELEKLSGRFTGLLPLEGELPKALIVVDSKEESIAVDEARHLGIPIVALANIDCDLSKVDYPIVGNDATATSIKFFLQELSEAYEAGKNASKVEKTETKEA